MVHVDLNWFVYQKKITVTGPGPLEIQTRTIGFWTNPDPHLGCQKDSNVFKEIGKLGELD
jgi:hypothetical protein